MGRAAVFPELVVGNKLHVSVLASAWRVVALGSVTVSILEPVRGVCNLKCSAAIKLTRLQIAVMSGEGALGLFIRLRSGAPPAPRNVCHCSRRSGTLLQIGNGRLLDLECSGHLLSLKSFSRPMGGEWQMPFILGE